MMRKFFMKRFRHFVSIMMVPTMVVLAALLIVIYQNDIRFLERNAENTLDALEENLELVLHNSLQQHELMITNPQMALSLEKLLTFEEMKYSDYVFFNSLRTILESIKKSHSYIDSIYLYIDGKDAFFSSNSGVCRMKEADDTGWYICYQEQPLDEKYRIEARTIMRSVGEEETLITIYQRMIATRGVVIVNVDADRFGELLSAMSFRNQEEILVLNEDGEILQMSSNCSGRVKDVDFSEWIRQKENSLQEWIWQKGRGYLLSIRKDINYDIYLVSVIPGSVLLSMMAGYIISFLILVTIEILIISYLSLTVTRRSFQQIEHIIQAFADAENGKALVQLPQTIDDEYDMIMNNAINMFIRNTLLHNEVTERKYKEEIAELRALQMQINPHFLFNTLQSINFEAERQVGEITVINHMIDYLSEILKYSMESAATLVRVCEELDILKKYVKIQQFRFGDDFVVYYEVEDECLDVRIPRLILQPLVENAIGHGIRPSGNRTDFIKLKIFQRDGWIYFIVFNTGCGISRKQIEEIYKKLETQVSEGIGLVNVNRRLQIYFGDESRIRISSKRELGTKVSFRIPKED